MLLLDTSCTVASLDIGDKHHAAVRDVLLATRTTLVLSPFVLAEVDYMLTTRVSQRAASHFLDAVAGGSYELAPMTTADIGRAHAVMQRHYDLKVGLADASIVVLAERHGTGDILTSDQRHFRTLTWHGNPFRILPADA